MTRSANQGNPFTVYSPEDMSAEDTVSLFVDVFSDFPKVRDQGHAFIVGPRGCGKSMIFRYLQPDCKRLVHHCSLAGLPFYGVYVPLKNTDLKLTEFRRLEDTHASVILNEHFLTLHVAQRTFKSLVENVREDDRPSLSLIQELVRAAFLTTLRGCGWNGPEPEESALASVSGCFTYMHDTCKELFKEVIQYLKKLSFRTEPLPFDGPLCGYLDFLFPLLRALRAMPFMPKGPIYLLIDDADNLSLVQTKVVNSWVSSRTSAFVSIKISTQFGYKTYRTVTGQRIDAPHDYYEVNISTVYTAAKKSTYSDRIRAIVAKRLERAGISATPEEFFPPDKKQEKAIERIADEYRSKWEETGRGFRPSDDAVRYARPDFIKGLAGARKSRSSYSYSGYSQLVHVSSGIIRHFLDAAAAMFSETLSRYRTVEAIPPGIQDQVLRQKAEEYLFREFEKELTDRAIEEPEQERLRRLYNLIRALGGTFQAVLLSDRSERRVFSIAFSDDAEEDILDVLRLGIDYGYFHVSSIGKKDGTGRTSLYVLSRRLAPFFTLDPTSFAGYLFVTSAAVREAMESPNRFLRKVKTQGVEVLGEPHQLALFD